MEKNIKNQNEQQSDRISTENIVNKPIAIDELNMSSKVTPGDIVPGGFTYPNNAIVQNDFLYLRDANGNQIAGRTVSIGDKITVLKIHHDKQLALVQYPAGSVVREGYVTNSTKVIKYLNEYNWVNDSSAEPVYETESSSDGKWGTLSAYEKATKLYKSNNRICVAYDTSKGAHTKSGFVEYEGGSNNSGSNNTNNINPGDIVPGGFTYPNNAVIENDFLYLRDANGNQIAGRTVSVGDKITVLDVGYAKQLALIQYPTSSGVRQGYVTNATNIIRYLDEYNYYNGSTSETVYADSTGSATLGSLNPYECATKLYSKDGRIHVVYDTDKGGHTKSGYVNFAGLDVPVTNITIPDISDSDVTKIEYGKSGKGRPLNVYKIGNGKKALFAGFALHGFEDHWFRDGEALVKIATDLIYKLANYKRTNGDLHGYTVYVAQCMNPDGVIEGRSQNGPGRCAVVSRVDMNRCFPYKFSVNTNSRYYTGSSPLGAVEAVKLRDLILKIRSESTETYVLDFHGWLGFTQGNYDAAKYIANQFGFTHNYTDAGGFFSSWANSLGSDIKGALIEYPKSTANYQSVLNGNYAGKTFNGIINLIKNNAGAGNSNTGNEDQAYNATGKVINVTSTLNVRNQPSTSGTVVGTLKSDQAVTITAKNGSWYKISYPIIGYVSNEFIQFVSEDLIDNLSQGNILIKAYELERYFGFTGVIGFNKNKIIKYTHNPKGVITITKEDSVSYDLHSISPGMIQVYGNGEFTIPSSQNFSTELIGDLKNGNFSIALKLFGGKVYAKVVSDLSIKLEFYHPFVDKYDRVLNYCLSFVVSFTPDPDEDDPDASSYPQFEKAVQEKFAYSFINTKKIYGRDSSILIGSLAIVSTALGVATASSNSSTAITYMSKLIGVLELVVLGVFKYM